MGAFVSRRRLGATVCDKTELVSYRKVPGRSDTKTLDPALSQHHILDRQSPNRTPGASSPYFSKSG